MNSFSAVVQLVLTFVAFIGIPVGVIFGIVFAALSSREVDAGKKKEYKKKMNLAFSLPFLLMVLALVLYGLVKTIFAFINH